MPTLHNWTLHRPEVFSPVNPRTTETYLKGNVYRHTRFPDGTPINTSHIRGIKGDGLVQTFSGSVYHLGEPEASYARRWPNASELLRDTHPALEDI